MARAGEPAGAEIQLPRRQVPVRVPGAKVVRAELAERIWGALAALEEWAGEEPVVAEELLQGRFADNRQVERCAGRDLFVVIRAAFRVVIGSAKPHAMRIRQDVRMVVLFCPDREG